MRTVTVYMSDGDTITTSINGTDQEIIRHYLGNRFEAASRRCGLELIENQRTFRNYNGRQTPCEHAIRVSGNVAAWEIGITTKQSVAGPEYELHYDGFMGGAGLIQHTRNDHGDLNRLITYYEEEVALAQFQAEGWMVERIEHQDGTLELVGCR